MAKDGKSTATPRVRFPEFRDAWEHKLIAQYLEECASRVAAPTSLPIYTSSRAGLTPQEEYYGGRTIVNDGEYGVVPPECFVFRHMSDDGLFKFHTNETGHDIAVSKEYPVFRAVNLNRHFLRAQLNHSRAFKAFALSQKAGGTRTRLYFSKLRTWETLLPSLAEQKKIAECLTSVDEVIAAQGRKVEALNAHKRGLTQQLFPREGERLPRLRFPEFCGGQPWGVEPLGKVVQLQSGFAFSSDFFGSRGQKLVTPKNFTKFGFGNFDNSVSKYTTEEVPQKFVCSPGDLLVLLTDLTPTCELLGKPLEVAEMDGNVLLNQRIVRVEPTSNLISKGFLKQFFLSDAYNEVIARTATGSTVRHSSNKVLESIEFVFPSPEEQQCIAGCLSSVDAQVAAEVKKLDALKASKKGLMQQLFASPERK